MYNNSIEHQPVSEIYVHVNDEKYIHTYLTNYTKHSPFFRNCLFIRQSWNSPPLTQYYHLPISPPLKPTLNQLHILCTLKRFTFKYMLFCIFLPHTPYPLLFRHFNSYMRMHHSSFPCTLYVKPMSHT